MINETIKYLEDNIKGMVISEDEEGIYYGTAIRTDFDLHVQLEEVDGDFSCIQYWVMEDDVQIGEDQIEFNEENIENVVNFFNEFPRVYLKIRKTLISLQDLAEDNNIDLQQVLNTI